ncbi:MULTISPECIES: TetR/AcrR family transcriptional regulator [Actinomadura]|uniref:DNA-binding transcriptional regulator, AcrR family n=1 Tax=Actinomadura madurae TaxID=1993 RepID=A0A1I5YTG8_9ACTN|nr:TetR/AcrR family transcriptional regulator [Actinomadura madurae]MCP9951827.1 TetR/AcrR family transcriptional regulator [Actinomadura madurae]MCP9968600.1 TetR/AcrR family transcriptional regulator [Actinomadura madurae]MCP9981072.1 TetR/AcrR family transcriptional regulator [Actinomadura madurae]MCQ0007433.1 TetR/AcrR family transcriptional regulator [Actinomadura madurae]MCQ0017266.1 TetR/AcrR family transcriptional regulator [Actinomadura madurae]
MPSRDDPGGPPLTERGARTRERLVAAAREVFEERGFPETRVAHITRHAGVAYGSFYTYFPSKEAVFLEVADRLFEEMTRQDLVPSAGPSPAARIRRANRAYYEAYRRNAKMMAIIEQVATFNEEFQRLRRKHRATQVGRSARAIARWQREGLVPSDLDAEMAARALGAMVDHSLYLWLVQSDDPPGTERLLDTLDALSVRALGLPSQLGDPWNSPTAS